MRKTVNMKIQVEKCEECGKQEEYRGSYDDCVRFCRECLSKMGDDELDEVCKYCSGCDTE